MNIRSEGDTKMLLSRVFALVECSLFLATFFVSAWYFEMIQGTETYGFYSKLIMILLGFIGILVHGKPREYGLVPKNLKFSLKWSLYIFLLFIGLGSIAILLTILFIRDNLRFDFGMLIVDFIWYFIFVGFAEEFFFRGFIQSRLNEVFTGKYKKIIGIEFEWSRGTLITAIFFFGLPHLLVLINPFTVRVQFSVFILIMSFVFAPFLGVIFGVLREKTGSIIVPAVLHAMIGFVGFGMGRITGMMISNIVVAIALFIFFAFFFEKILKSESK
ncbi:MAG: hypothetical protein DRI28_03205 [Caldiserica bacterium]|nr:MAG: hypothetical protein DRI28_03205 [Caldisericota bacterium]